MIAAMVLSWVFLLFTSGVLSAPTNEVAASAPAKVRINPSLFPVFTRYAHFASASYNVPCPKPPYGTSIVKYENIDSTSTQATVFQDNNAKEFIIAFPGTASKRDEETDLMYNLTSLIVPGVGAYNCGGCTIHEGVLIAYASIRPALEALLTTLRAEKPSYALTLTGHSLGASIATVAYASLRGLGFPIRNVYTYGSPRVGNPTFASHIDSLAGASTDSTGHFFRLTHKNDTVPQLPPLNFGYYHTLTEFFLDVSDGAQETASTTYRCSGPENLACSRGNVDIYKGGSGHGYYANVYMGTGGSCGEG